MGRTTKIGRRLLLGVMVWQFFHVVSAGSQVQITETTVTIPTYAYEQVLYVPDPWDRAYPYTKFDLGAVATSPTDRTYTAVIMENAYLKVVILPEIGGRIYEVRFKPTGELVFYMNDVIKPFYAGPRWGGGWLSVG